MIITIDPGHGGRDPGAVGQNGLFEKDVVLDVAQKIVERNKNENLNIRLLRNNDRFIPLRQRLAVQGSAIFISLHCNGFHLPTANGVETFFMANHNPHSMRLAQVLQEEMVENLKLRDRGVKQPPRGFAVLRINRPIPSALVEFAFITNPAEESLLASQEFRNLMANSILAGIQKFISRRA